MTRRFLSAAAVLAALGLILSSVRGMTDFSPFFGGDEEQASDGNKHTLILWYTDEALTDFLNREASRFGTASDDVRVLPVLVSGLGFLEEVGKASALGEDFPDLYITTHDNLEKAALAGLAAEVEHPEDYLRGDNYPQAALDAVTWHDRQIGYPFYAETISLLYNRTYLEEEVRRIAEEDGEAEPTGEVLDKRVEDMLPGTLEDLLAFAGNYNAPDGVESIFRFDVNDLFTDYFFAGDALSVGGPAGDDPQIVDVYNERALTCMDIYQQLGQFFSTGTDTVNGETLLQDFLDGKTVYTIATTEAVRKIAEKREEGTCDYVFGAAPLFDLTETLPTRALSVTNCIVINGFSEHPGDANRFARFLADDGVGELYPRAGKLSARYRAGFGEDPDVNAMMRAYAQVYEDSVPMPKMLETSNYWIRLEIAFSDIWNGADVNATMKQVAEQLLMQIQRTPTELQPLEDFPHVQLSEDLSEEGE
ncbi:MAG: extracellular solute-binding protein [Lachnospiraceae bacterium]|nr:extracellular solute-binding protein [Lachnospiraceae bacterium]